MGRGKRNNKKKSGKGAHEAPVSRTYLKIEATFKCSSDKCKKTWTSVHAWERDEAISCEICGSNAAVDDFKDEMGDLDNFRCACGEKWESMHSGLAEECWECGRSVPPNGTQNRFGRHFWFICTNEKCKADWEDFSIEPQRTQRCSGCKSRGDIIKTRKVKSKPVWLLRKEAEARQRNGGGGGGKHNWEYCDMCQNLKSHGKASCLSFRKVQFQVNQMEDGRTVEVLTGASVT